MKIFPIRDPQSLFIPLLVASAIQLVLLIFVVGNWMDSSQPVVMVPKHIQATLLQLDKPKAAGKKPEPKPVPEPAPVVKPKPEEKKPAPEKKAEPAPKPKPEDNAIDISKKKAEQELKKKQEEKKKRADELAQAANREKRMAELDKLLAAEMAEDEANEEKNIGTYMGQIRQLIQENWKFPPGSTHDMKVVLRINLVPTGEITEVQIEKSSGNEAFDTSAKRAFWTVKKLPVPEDSVVFERHFRVIHFPMQSGNARL